MCQHGCCCLRAGLEALAQPALSSNEVLLVQLLVEGDVSAARAWHGPLTMRASSGAVSVWAAGAAH